MGQCGRRHEGRGDGKLSQKLCHCGMPLSLPSAVRGREGRGYTLERTWLCALEVFVVEKCAHGRSGTPRSPAKLSVSIRFFWWCTSGMSPMASAGKQHTPPLCGRHNGTSSLSASPLCHQRARHQPLSLCSDVCFTWGDNESVFILMSTKPMKIFKPTLY